MKNINHVCISGNVTRDPELKGSGESAILKLTLAVNGSKFNKHSQKWEDVPNYVDCVIFGQRAEKVSDYIRKGSKLMVDGELRYSTWEKDGQKRSKLEVAVNTLELPPRKSEPAQPVETPAPVEDDDFPF